MRCDPVIPGVIHIGGLAAALPHVQITKQGVFRYRRRVPSGLVAVAAKREVLISLKTKDRSVAELRLLEVHLQVERWLRSLNAGAPAAGFQSPMAIQPTGFDVASIRGTPTEGHIPPHIH
ncbi:DUF6538 domain-containing protein [Aquabacter sp. L1I39]|uniref:DUF6538 domain-containing protein n=1 Tax=Aquabacter sp. L1I39 TaxID=2820278 RepID=UPI00406C0E0C